MGLFDGKKEKQLEYLEEERKKLWNRIINLENTNKALQKEIQKKASDSEKEAAQSSRKAAEFKNKTEQRLEEAGTIVSEIKKHLNSAENTVTNIASSKVDVEKNQTEILEIKNQLKETEAEYQASLEKLDNRIAKFDGFLVKYPDLENQLEEADENLSKILDIVEKSSVSLNALNKRKKDIDDMHREIFGYSQTDAEGNTTKVEGLKDELSDAYEKLSVEITESQEKVEQINADYKTKFENFEKGHDEKYKAITEEITALLPNALTAGLSAAFSKKKEEEVSSSHILQKRFNLGIYLLIGVSFLPFILNGIFLYQGIGLQEAINRLPRLVLAIIPMYIPVLWFTYSANKKLNLSKRLIEEYAHKEVLSKTYEGLSKQINGISGEGQSDELKFRLLSNFLQVSSENPGKLISNYEASDHPIMEALEQSYKFQIAIDRLEGIPGLGKVAAILESKAKKKIENKQQVIEKALVKEMVEEEETDA